MYSSHLEFAITTSDAEASLSRYTSSRCYAIAIQRESTRIGLVSLQAINLQEECVYSAERCL